MPLNELWKMVGGRQEKSAEPNFDEIELYLSAPRFFSRGFRLRRSSKRSNHRIGGQSQSPVPKCGTCGAALSLFANLDATDHRLKGNHLLKRLPFYYCCSCPGPVYYRVQANGRVTPIPAKAAQYEECPFESQPRELPSGYLELREIPEELARTMLIAQEPNQFQELTKNELREIAAVLGRKPQGRWDLYFSQVGGAPITYQGGDEGKPGSCPNTKCPNRRRRKREFEYRRLAVLDLWNDTFWLRKPKDALQIVFHICPGCFTVAAKYTCT